MLKLKVVKSVKLVKLVPSKMAPTKTTNAQRCKKYRKKNQERYRASDSLRKKHQRQEMKILCREKYETMKLKERLRKQQSRKKQKHILAELNTQSTPASTSSTFTHRATKNRSLKKVETSLPKSPGKRNEIISSLATKFQIRIAYQPKRGRNKDVLSEKERKYLIEFFDKQDISYMTPGRKDNVYIGKVNGVSQYEQKRYLLWTLRTF